MAKELNIHTKPTQKVGFVLKSHGYKGHVKICWDNNPTLTQKKFILIEINEKYVPFKIEEINADKTIVKFRFVDTLEQAAEIENCNILSFSNKNNTENEISFLEYQLIDNKTKASYPIVEIIEMPQQTLIEFQLGYKTALFPYHADLIEKIDHRNKKIIANFPDGLLDI